MPPTRNGPSTGARRGRAKMMATNAHEIAQEKREAGIAAGRRQNNQNWNHAYAEPFHGVETAGQVQLRRQHSSRLHQQTPPSTAIVDTPSRFQGQEWFSQQYLFASTHGTMLQGSGPVTSRPAMEMMPMQAQQLGSATVDRFRYPLDSCSWCSKRLLPAGWYNSVEFECHWCPCWFAQNVEASQNCLPSPPASGVGINNSGPNGVFYGESHNTLLDAPFPTPSLQMLTEPHTWAPTENVDTMFAEQQQSHMEVPEPIGAPLPQNLEKVADKIVEEMTPYDEDVEANWINAQLISEDRRRFWQELF